mmetsp:Transcript_9660/g.24537  ORF Transcript_9660/g.24537 Transcript_9660/m.24537 type:complete len:212 (+) Transcript_9660:289-924(+)
MCRRRRDPAPAGAASWTCRRSVRRCTASLRTLSAPLCASIGLTTMSGMTERFAALSPRLASTVCSTRWTAPRSGSTFGWRPWVGACNGSPAGTLRTGHPRPLRRRGRVVTCPMRPRPSQCRKQWRSYRAAWCRRRGASCRSLPVGWGPRQASRLAGRRRLSAGVSASGGRSTSAFTTALSKRTTSRGDSGGSSTTTASGTGWSSWARRSSG